MAVVVYSATGSRPCPRELTIADASVLRPSYRRDDLRPSEGFESGENDSGRERE